MRAAMTPTLLPSQHWKTPFRGRAGWLLLGLAALVAPHLLAAMPLGPLDLLGSPPTEMSRSEIAGETFPGSAFFFAEGAFDPVPGTSVNNSAHVLEMDSGPAAATLAFRGISPLDNYRALNCLTSAIYYEAGNESDDGQRAVAQVVLNRVRHPAYPHSVCGVVYQGTERGDIKCQFTFGCDGAMARVPNQTAWQRARRVAMAALGGSVYAPVGLATHYHTLAVHPNWSTTLKPVAVIGAHIFYRWQGGAGTPAAFSARYTGLEVQSGPAPKIWLPVAEVVLGTLPTNSSPAMPAAAVAPPATPASMPNALPESTMRPEYRNSGRPLI